MPNDWYTKHAKEVTTALSKGKTAPKDAAVPCTLVKMGDGAFLLCANVSAAKASALVKEAKTNGGKVIVAGALYKGPEGVTFAVAEGSTAVKKQFSDAAATATGKAMSVVVLVVAPPAAPPAPAAGPDAAEDFKARASRLVAAAKQAPKEVQAVVQPPLVQALALGKEGRYAEADPLLKRVESGLAVAAGDAATPGAARAPDAAVDFKARVIRLVAAVKQAPKEVQTAVQPPLVQALALGKEGRYAEADPLLKRVENGLAAAPAAQPAAAVTPAPASVRSEKVQFTERFKALRTRYIEKVGTNPPNKALLEKAMGLAVQAAKVGNFTRGLKLLEGLEKALGKAAAGPAVPSAADEAAAPAPAEVDGAGKFAADWETAVTTVRGALASFQTKLRQMADPDLVVIANDGVAELLKKLPGSLAAALKAAETGGPEVRKQALPLLAQHRQFLQSDKLIGEVDANPFGAAPVIRETLTKALDALDKALS